MRKSCFLMISAMFFLGSGRLTAENPVIWKTNFDGLEEGMPAPSFKKGMLLQKDADSIHVKVDFPVQNLLDLNDQIGVTRARPGESISNLGDLVFCFDFRPESKEFSLHVSLKGGRNCYRYRGDRLSSLNLLFTKKELEISAAYGVGQEKDTDTSKKKTPEDGELTEILDQDEGILAIRQKNSGEKKKTQGDAGQKIQESEIAKERREEATLSSRMEDLAEEKKTPEESSVVNYRNDERIPFPMIEKRVCVLPDRVLTPGQWNRIRIVADAYDLSVFVNGKKIAEHAINPGSGDVQISLLGGSASFRELEIQEIRPVFETYLEENLIRGENHE